MARKARQPISPRTRRIRIVLLVIFALFALPLVGIGIIGARYAGPETMGDVALAMPGVPIFPLSDVSPRNLAAQRWLAVPLFLVQLQGAKRADAALLQAPADRDFIVDWYTQAAPYQDWDLQRREELSTGTRLVYTRNHELLQLVISNSGDGLFTPVQMIYVNGLTDKQLSQIVR